MGFHQVDTIRSRKTTLAYMWKMVWKRKRCEAKNIQKVISTVQARTKARTKAMAVVMENGKKEEHEIPPKFLAMGPGRTVGPSRSTRNITEAAALK